MLHYRKPRPKSRYVVSHRGGRGTQTRLEDLMRSHGLYDIAKPSSQAAVREARRTNAEVFRHMVVLGKMYNGGKENVSFRTFEGDGTPHTSLETRNLGALQKPVDWYTIHMPNFKSWSEARNEEAKKNNGEADPEQTYRLYKGSWWHENQHVHYTPTQFLKMEDPEMSSQLRRTLFNIIDDLRIEEKGVQSIPAATSLRLLRQAYWGSQRPDLTKLSKLYTDENELKQDPGVIQAAERIAQENIFKATRHWKDPNQAEIDKAFEDNKENFKKSARKMAVIEGFTQLLLMNKQNGNLPEEDKKKVEEVVQEVKEELRKKLEKSDDPDEVYRGLKSLVGEVLKKLDIEELKVDPMPEPDPHGDGEEFGDRNPNAGKVNSAVIVQFLKSLVPEKESREDGDPASIITKEDIENAIQGTDRDKQEFAQVLSGKLERIENEDPDAPDQFEEPQTAGNPEQFRDRKFISETEAELKAWHSGWRRIFGETGSNYDVDRELATAGKEAFSGRQRLDASKTKTLFVVDMSGSIAGSGQEDNYKKVLGSTLEVLENIRAKTAVFGFGEQNAEFFKLKDFKQKWNRQKATTLAGMEAHGSTPLGATLNGLSSYIKKNRPQYTVIITDGVPDDSSEARRAIQKISKDTKVVAFGLGGEELGRKLGELGIAQHFSTENLYAIPKWLIPRIAPRR